MDFEQMAEDILASFDVSDSLKAELREKTALLALYTSRVVTSGQPERHKDNMKQVVSQIASLVGIAEAEIRNKVEQQIIVMVSKLITAALA